METTGERVSVPPDWAARGFSGQYHQRGAVTWAVAAAIHDRLPCQHPADQAWLLLDLDVPDHADEGPPTVTMVRLDAMALLDLSARRPVPGAYRPAAS